MISIPSLLEPVSAESPSGEDLSYDPSFLELQTKLRGKEETQFSAAEEPNWKELTALATRLAKRGKHLQLGVVLTLALLQTEGLIGFRDGLILLEGWLDRYWDTLYPLLDPDDNLDPTERVNLLQCLSVTGLGDPYRFCERLGQTPLCDSPVLGRHGLTALTDVAAAPTAEGAEAKPGLGAAQAAAALRDTPAEWLQARFAAATESLAALKAIEQGLCDRIGGSVAPNFEALKRTLAAMRDLMGTHVGAPPGGEAAAPAAEDGAGPTPRIARSGAGGVAGPLQSREDVLAALTSVCDYYRRFEPSSPVPFLLQRARRLVTMDFMQIMGDLAPDALAQMRTITGTPEPPAA